jgi:hypothetical protein
MNMKKIFKGTLALIVGLLMLTGCSSNNSGANNGNNSAHTHSYTTQVIAPTCTEQGYTLHTCVDGDDSYKDSYTNPLGHSWVEGEKNYHCSRCNQSEAEFFTFKQGTMDGESCYVITNVTSKAVINNTLEVPRKYESLPVRGIMNWAFSGVTKEVKKVIIHSNIKNIYSNLWHGTGTWTPDWETMSSLEEIVFDTSCSGMRIEAGAFNNCPSLAKANISKGMIKYAPADPVTTQNGGTAEYLFKGTPYFTNYANCKSGLYYIADLLLYADLNEINSNITIDSGTVLINPCLFNKCTSIERVTIPNSIGVIGSQAFNGCAKLASITYSGTVSQFKSMIIGPSVFSGTKAKSITCNDGNVTSYTYNGYTYEIGG